jgi:predicted unusual protein kinase regulating ubiquinone biosynthesis (AarF/ABC1/UbiB family)
MERMGFIIQGADYGALQEATQYLIDKYRDITPTELKAVTIDDISEDIENVIGIIKFIQIPNNFILLGRTIGMLNGIAFTLNPELNMIGIATPYVKEFLRGGPEERRRHFLNSVRERISDLWDFPARVDEFLTKANRGELAFRLSKPELEEITGRLKSISNVMMLVILTVTAASAALLFLLIGSRTSSLIAAGATVTLCILSVLKLMRD